MNVAIDVANDIVVETTRTGALQRRRRTKLCPGSYAGCGSHWPWITWRSVLATSTTSVRSWSRCTSRRSSQSIPWLSRRGPTIVNLSYRVTSTTVTPVLFSSAICYPYLTA